MKIIRLFFVIISVIDLATIIQNVFFPSSQMLYGNFTCSSFTTLLDPTDITFFVSLVKELVCSSNVSLKAIKLFMI